MKICTDKKIHGPKNENKENARTKIFTNETFLKTFSEKSLSFVDRSGASREALYRKRKLPNSLLLKIKNTEP